MDARKSPQLVVNTGTELQSFQELVNIDGDDEVTSPNVINVLNLPKKQKLNIAVFGCQGTLAVEYPKQVAALLNQKAQEFPELAPDLIIILGDNFYPDGVSSPSDPRFNTQFHDIYGNPELKLINGIPCLVVLGNHDAGRDTKTQIKNAIPGHNLSYYTSTNPLINEQAEKQQVLHSIQQCKPDFFLSEHVNYEELPKHIMPHYFHSWIFDKLQVFALNSNTYVKDYLNYLYSFAFDENIDSNNQAVWVQRKYEEAIKSGRETLFALHHPLFSAGKRVYDSGWDAWHYLDKKDITLLSLILEIPPNEIDFNDLAFKEKLRKIFDETHECYRTNANYNEMLTNIIYHFQKMSPSMVCTAHDHSNYYYNNKKDDNALGPKICQVVAGGGGSEELQHRFYFGEHKNVGAFIREHGFSIISFDNLNPKIFDINTFTTNDCHLTFTSESSEPISAVEQDNDVAVICDIVLTACNKYLNFLHEKQQEYGGKFFETYPSGKALYKNIFTLGGLYSTIKNCAYNWTHTHGDVDIMHDIMNYLNQPESHNYKETITFLHANMSKLYNKTYDDSLYMDINDGLKKAFADKTIVELFNELNSLQLKLS